MAKKLYLISGHTSTGRLKDIDSRALSDADNRNVLVLNLSYDDLAKNQGKGEFFKQYFREIGAENVALVESNTSNEQTDKHIRKSGLIYLPGGDTKILINNLRSKGLNSRLESFNGVIGGNSAGAYAMCPDYLRIGRGEIEIIPSLGFVDFWTKAHYESKFDGYLIELSKNRVIYGLENESAIVCSDSLKFIGNIWRFSKKQKEKIN